MGVARAEVVARESEGKLVRASAPARRKPEMARAELIVGQNFSRERDLSLRSYCRRQFRGKVGSNGFEKVLIGTRGARETFL